MKPVISLRVQIKIWLAIPSSERINSECFTGPSMHGCSHMTVLTSLAMRLEEPSQQKRYWRYSWAAWKSCQKLREILDSRCSKQGLRLVFVSSRHVKIPTNSKAMSQQNLNFVDWNVKPKHLLIKFNKSSAPASNGWQP